MLRAGTVENSSFSFRLDLPPLSRVVACRAYSNRRFSSVSSFHGIVGPSTSASGQPSATKEGAGSKTDQEGVGRKVGHPNWRASLIGQIAPRAPHKILTA
jgi:hypothetical protein